MSSVRLNPFWLTLVHFVHAFFFFEGRAGFGYDFKCLTGTTPEKRDFDKAVGGFINPIAFLFGSWLAKKLKTQARREIDAAVSRSEKVRSSGCHLRISR